MPSLPDFVAGTVLTAAALDAAFAQLFPTGGNGQSYVPTLTQGVTVTKNIEYAEYIQVGGWAFVNVSVAPTSAGTAAQPVIIGLPPLVPVAFRMLGMGLVYDASANTWYDGKAMWVSATTARLVPSAATAALGQVGFTAGLASGDLVGLNLAYRTSTNP